jgi:hypothetical protein
MSHPCDKCRFEGFCVHESNICRELFFAIADGRSVEECPAKVWEYYHGVEGVFA